MAVRPDQKKNGKFIVKHYDSATTFQTHLNQWISQGYNVKIEAVQLVPPESGGGIFAVIWREKVET